MPLTLRPSPNELARIEKQQAEAARIERLQKARQQEKQWSRSLRHRYQDALQRHIKDSLRHMNSKWEEWQDEQIDQMSKAIDEAQQSVGQAHRQAADQTENMFQQARELKRELRKQMERENGRFDAALHAHLVEEAKRRHDEMLHLHRLHLVRLHEHMRAANLNLPTTPMVHVDDAETAPVTAAVDYSRSRLHDRYMAVKVDAVVDEGRNAITDAVEAQRRHEIEQQALAEKRQRQLQATQERTGQAHHHLRMQKEREQLCEALEKLNVDDQRRKQTLLRRTAVNSSQPAVAKNRQQWLERFFESNFVPSTVPNVPATLSTINPVSETRDASSERTPSPRRNLQ